MYAGYVESPEQIEARKRRILAGQYRRPGKGTPVKAGKTPTAKTQVK